MPVSARISEYPMTLLYTDPLFLKHETGRHPECPDRLRSISSRLRDAGLIERCTVATSTPLTEDEVREVHDPAVVERVKDAARAGGGWLDADTFVSPASFEVALAAAGASASAVDAVLSGPERTALCLVRPPGHHATPTQSMGFCLFNNIALAAHHARTRAGLSRILIVDWDVHHGNGTQDIFYEDPTVMFFSIHRYGHGFYPGTGAAEETGSGPGLGYTRNEPIRFGTSRSTYHDRFRKALEESARRIRPELVLVSAGFDAHHDDPIGSLGLETEDFAVLTREVLAIAKSHAGGRLVSCLEGGYNLEALAESVQAHLTTLLSESA
jgi:acetoin utilization deacetylase AcuC-like enzyme